MVPVVVVEMADGLFDWTIGVVKAVSTCILPEAKAAFDSNKIASMCMDNVRVILILWFFGVFTLRRA